MALFQLDPQSIAARVRASPEPVRAQSLVESIVHGTLGFAAVSLAGFAPWPVAERWFGWIGEVGLYIACTVVFIGLSGLLLHRLIIGPGSLGRFYKLFSLAFIVYAVLWVVFWMWRRGHPGSIAGLLAGTAAMGTIFAFAFDAMRSIPKVVIALFILNTLGFYAGGWVEGKLAIDHRLAAMFLWGLCYGLGFGAGLGAAFYFCQAGVRSVLGESSSSSSS